MTQERRRGLSADHAVHLEPLLFLELTDGLGESFMGRSGRCQSESSLNPLNLRAAVALLDKLPALRARSTRML